MMQERERDLLRAALLSGEPAATAFVSWQKEADLDHLPFAEHSMLPMLYHNLEELGVDHPWMGRMKGVYRRTWYANQLALRTLATVQETMVKVVSPVLVTGAAALQSTVGENTAVFPIFTLELIVPWHEANSAQNCLQDLGWQAEPTCSYLHQPDFHTWVAGHRFVNAQGQELQLYWRVIPAEACELLDAACRAAALPLNLNNIPGHTLCLTDHLLRNIIAASSGSLVSMAATVRLIAQPDVDWSRLLNMSTNHRLTSPVIHVLEAAATSLDAPVPPAILEALHQIRGGSFTKWMELVRNYLAQRGILQRSLPALRRYWRTVACLGTRPSPSSFTLFWQYTRRLDSRWQIPRDVLRWRKY